VGALVPAPARGKLIGLFEALLTNETLPLELPVADGVKVRLKDVLPPATRVTGRVIPLAL
jgi:hypothetical protein